MSQVTGFDNRRFLPPYFPVTRGEDKLFGQMTRYVYPNSVALDYPWAVPHLPLPQRNWAENDNSFAVSRYFPGLLVDDLVGANENCLAPEPQERMAYLARLFEDLGSAPDAALLERLAADRHRYRASQMRKLRQQIKESAGLPADWLGYLKRALQQVQSSQLGSFGTQELKGTVGNLQGQDLLDFWKGAWREFGHSLPAWREIRQAAEGIVAESFAD
jgi:hypothetical protein